MRRSRNKWRSVNRQATKKLRHAVDHIPKVDLFFLLFHSSAYQLLEYYYFRQNILVQYRYLGSDKRLIELYQYEKDERRWTVINHDNGLITLFLLSPDATVQNLSNHGSFLIDESCNYTYSQRSDLYLPPPHFIVSIYSDDQTFDAGRLFLLIDSSSSTLDADHSIKVSKFPIRYQFKLTIQI